MPVTDYDNFNDPAITGQNPTAAPAPVLLQPTPEQTAAAMEIGRNNFQHPVWDPRSGTYGFIPMSAGEKATASLDQFEQTAQQAPAAPALPGYADVVGQNSPATQPVNPYGDTRTVEDRLAATGGRSIAGQTPVTTARGAPVARGAVDPAAARYSGMDAIAAPPQPGAQAPTVNRGAVDPILGGLQGYENRIAALAGDQTGLSLAEAQLLKSDKLASLRAANELQQNQAGALGQARSARNRGDVALLERQAVGEQAYLGQEAQRQDVLRQAELEGNQAILRAGEEDADRRFKLDALKTAGDLGLNTAALEVDISKADQASANNWINNEFQQQGINKQLDQAQTEAALNFARDMASIELEYDKLDAQSQQFIVDAQLQKYGIDQDTYRAIRQAKEANKFKWGNFFQSFVGGAASGGTGAVVTKILGK